MSQQLRPRATSPCKAPPRLPSSKQRWTLWSAGSKHLYAPTGRTDTFPVLAETKAQELRVVSMWWTF